MNISTQERLASDYRRHGNTHPPRPVLGSVLNFATAGEVQGGAQLWLAAAHASIDLARHAPPKRAMKVPHVDHLHGKARAFFGRVIERAEELRCNDAEGYRMAAPYAVSATIQLQELSNWYEVTKGNMPTNNYEALLGAAHDALRYVAPEETRACLKLRDFMPVLLGGRSHQQNGAGGWLGRSALYRDEWRLQKKWDPSQKAATEAANWNAGICLPDLDHTFENPLRIKVVGPAPYRGYRASRAAGVVVISSVDCPIDEAERIILSCMNEFEPTPTPEGMKLFSPGQLDAITGITELFVRREACHTALPNIQ